MVVILTEEDLEDLRNGKLVKVISHLPIQKGEIFGIATQKWVDESDKCKDKEN